MTKKYIYVKLELDHSSLALCTLPPVLMPASKVVSSEQSDEILTTIELEGVEIALRKIQVKMARDLEKSEESGFVWVVEKYERMWRQAAEQAGVGTHRLEQYLRSRQRFLPKEFFDFAYNEIQL